MLALFRTNQALANILILLYLGLVRAVVFIHPPDITPLSEGILSSWVLQSSPPSSNEAKIAAIMLIFIQAIFINGFMWRYRIGSQLTLLPGMFYALAASILPDFLTLSPILLANTFLILALYYLFSIYRRPQAADLIFDVGIWIGTASLFYFSYWVFMFWGFIGLATLRGIRPKEFLMLLIGMLIPYFLLGVYLYWNNRLPELLGNHVFGNAAFCDFSFPLHDTMTYLKFGMLGALVLLSMFSAASSGRRDVSTEKFVNILYWMLIIAAATWVAQRHVGLSNLQVLSLPLGLLLSLAVFKIKESFAETLHFLLLLVILIVQYMYKLS